MRMGMFWLRIQLMSSELSLYPYFNKIVEFEVKSDKVEQ